MFAFQLIPISSSSFDGFNNHAENTKSIIFAGYFDNDTLIFSQGSRKPSPNVSAAKLQGPFEAQVCYQNYSTNNLKQKEIIVDFRRKIEITIPDYFHGSKYKIIASLSNK